METFVYTAPADATAILINVVMARVGDIGTGPPQVYVAFNNKIRLYAGAASPTGTPTLTSFAKSGLSIRAFEA